jgi:hypothetical protein
MDIAITGRRRSPEEEELERMRGERVADSIEEDARFARVAADPAKDIEAANGQGSFEGFMSAFGGGSSPDAMFVGGSEATPSPEP